jgi:prepilin-type N-terminal cleavage/methylation domain-containing protein
MYDASASSAEPRAARGMTLVEVIVAVAVMGIIMTATIPFFTYTQSGYTSLEVTTVLPAAMQKALSKIQHRIVENCRIFDSGSIGTAYRARATPNISPAVPSATASPPAIPSKLPLLSPDMTLSVTSSTFNRAAVGNSLFFASTDAPYEAPSGGGLAVKVDTFIFNYFYLVRNSATLNGQPAIELHEWHSTPYVDYARLISITDTAKSTSTIAWLYSRGLRHAWDRSSNDPNNAFYSLNSAGMMTLAPLHNIQTSTDPLLKPAAMISIIRGAASGGFHYGVCPNNLPAKNQVPQFASASGDFPAGFETIVVGEALGRQVFVRLTMAAQGNFKGFKTFENISLFSCRDIY